MHLIYYSNRYNLHNIQLYNQPFMHYTYRVENGVSMQHKSAVYEIGETNTITCISFDILEWLRVIIVIITRYASRTITIYTIVRNNLKL